MSHQTYNVEKFELNRSMDPYIPHRSQIQAHDSSRFGLHIPMFKVTVPCCLFVLMVTLPRSVAAWWNQARIEILARRPDPGQGYQPCGYLETTIPSNYGLTLSNDSQEDVIYS